MELPLVSSDSEVYSPTVEHVEMIRNVPERAEDGIYHHGALCECWLCDEDSPEFVPRVWRHDEESSDSYNSLREFDRWQKLVNERDAVVDAYSTVEVSGY